MALLSSSGNTLGCSVASASSSSLLLLDMAVVFRFILQGSTAEDTASDTVPLLPLSVETKQSFVARNSSSLSDSESSSLPPSVS